MLRLLIRADLQANRSCRFNGINKFIYLPQKLRVTLLEIIHRLPCNDALKPYVEAILATIMHLLDVENDETGVICLKILLGMYGGLLVIWRV
jgi:hypothetical protein